MAQETAEIYQALIAEKNTMTELTGLQPGIDDAQTLLADLTTPSKVADWRLWLYIFASASRALQTLWDRFEERFLKMATEAKAGSAPWLHKKGLEFQNGFNLTWNGNEFVYDNAGASEAAIAASKIIKRLAIVETGGRVIVKAAKLSGGLPVPLSAGEVTALNEYMAKISPAGTTLIVHSRNPDDLLIILDIVRDATLIDGSGELIASPGVFPVQNAINNYIANLPFNGQITNNAFQDAIQAATGVKRVRVLYFVASYGSVQVVISDKYTPDAGYATIGSLTINYSVDVY
jgi:hypothetical protein